MSSKTPASGEDGGSSSSSSYESDNVSISSSLETAADYPPPNPYCIDIPPPPPPPGTEDEIQLLDASQNADPSTLSTIIPLYANYSTNAYYHATPPPSYSQRAHPGRSQGYPYSFYSQPSPYAQYNQSYYQGDPHRHYYQTAPYPIFSQTTDSQDYNSQPDPYQSYSVATAPTAGYSRASYYQAGPSTSYFLADSLASYFEVTSSANYSLANSSEAVTSASYAQVSSSVTYSQAVPSTSYSEAVPSTSYSEAGPSTSYSEAVPSTSYSEAGPSTSYSEVGPSTSYSEVGASTSYSEDGPSTSYSEAGPSTSYSQAGPSSAGEPEAGPSSGEPQVGPSSDELQASPSTSSVSNFSVNPVYWLSPRQYPQYSETYTVKVNNINCDTTLETLRSYFRPFGPLGDLVIGRDPVTEASKGYAFVKYYDRRHALNAASAMTGAMLDGREIRAEVLAPDHPDISTTRTFQPPPSNAATRHFTIKVTNINFRATADMLKLRLERTGTVSYINMPLRPSGLNKGYAYVRYAKVRQAAQCIHTLNNTIFEGRKLIIRQSTSRPVTSSSDDSD